MHLTAGNINQIVKSRKSFAIFRLPGEKKLHVKAGHWKRKKFSELKKECFFVQPFSPEEKGFALFPGEKKEKSKKQKLLSSTPQKKYNERFASFIQEINSGNVSKLVLSKITESKKAKINIGKSFLQLCKNYPNATVNLFFIPEAGLWMGASPELLLQSNGKETKSMSLAGTMANGQKSWTKKEKEEQRIVTGYIEKAFKKYFSGSFLLKQETIKAGNVKHLRNNFHSKKKTSWKSITKLVDKLHPTPAVNGFPKKKALQFIQNKEGHSRDLYAGFFGMVNPENNLLLFVNIRCMKLVNNKAYLFTGGGITAQSVASKEWKEAQLKAEGLINSLCIGEN